MKDLYFVLVSDFSYIKPTAVSITSVIKNIDKEYRCVFYVLAFDYTVKPNEFINLEKKYNCIINLIYTGKYDFYFKNQSKDQFMNTWISFATYHRLLMFKILPKCVDVAMYIDSDVIVDKNITHLFKNFKKEKLFAAVVEVSTIKEKNTVYKYLKDITDFAKYESNPKKYPYFNAGFFLCNIELSRKMNVFEDILDFLSRYNPKLADQDTLNAVFGQKHSDLIYFLGPEYDVFSEAKYDQIMDKDYFYSREQVIDAMHNPYIIHYAGYNKPWINNDYLHFHNIWEKYAKYAGFHVKKKRSFKRVFIRILPSNTKRGVYCRKIYHFCKKFAKKILGNPYHHFKARFYLPFKIRFNEYKKRFKPKKNYIRTYVPMISVIVPNYNHSKYLKRRLNSIYNQTYKNIEVIILDDCSTDKSIEIIQKYVKKHKNNTVFYPNKKNSGSVFKQWKKGILKAKGDLIWIAESDDFCSIYFLDELVDFFENKDIAIAFGRTVAFDDKKGIIYTQENNYCDIKFNWRSKFICEGQNFVDSGFGYKNCIPNVSQVIFRKINFDKIFNDESWFNTKIAGDWAFYLFLLRNNKIAYNFNATNFHRYHISNTSLSDADSSKILKDYKVVASYLIKYAAPSYNCKINFLINCLNNQDNILPCIGSLQEIIKILL